MIVTLEQIKQQLGITENFDDAMLERKVAAAQNHIERLLGYRIEEEFGGQDQEDVPPALAEAVAQLAAHWYENRESVVTGTIATELPIGVSDIVTEYRKWSWSDDG